MQESYVPPGLLPAYARRPFFRFFSNPYEEPTVRMFFDNIRNYTIAGALILTARVISGASWNDRLASIGLETLGWILVAMNGLQLVLLTNHVLHRALRFSATEARTTTAKGTLKFLLLLSAPIFLTWAMWRFVLAALSEIRK
jgi:hypothetical protein